jgi:hypothetical protein
MEATNSRNRKFRTACDRCYGLKERCERSTSSATCARCRRLNVQCTTERPVRPAGRRVHRGEKTSLGKTSGKSRDLPQCHDTLEMYLGSMDQQPEERELLMFLLGEPGNLDQYVVCPSFQVEQQQSLAVQLPAALPSLKDAYIACAITLKQLQSDAGGAGVNISLSFHYISKAMSTLRSLPVLLSQDTVVCHTLGSALAFAIFSAIGVGVPDICRYCLGATSSLLNTQASGTQNDPWESFLILLDTMDCFFHRLNPIRRVRVPSGFVVDRHLGLCLPLMPLYHDLCVISN